MFFFFHLSSFLLALKRGLARHRAAPLQICCHPQDLVWSCIPARHALASAASPSCTALTVTTTCHQSASPETLPLLENCKLKISSGVYKYSCSWGCAQQIYLLNFRHGEDIIVTPFAQVRTAFKGNQLNGGLRCGDCLWIRSQISFLTPGGQKWAWQSFKATVLMLICSRILLSNGCSLRACL